MRRFPLVPLFAACFATAQIASGITFTLNMTMGGDSTVFPTGSYGILVADTGGDGFQALTSSQLLQGATTLSPNSLLGSNDLIVFSNLSLLSSGGNNYFELGATNFDTNLFTSANWAAGNQLGVFWFQSGSSNAGDSFGFFRSDSVANGTISFVTPSAGSTSSIVNTTAALGGTTTPQQYSAQPPGGVIAVPEPSATALIVIGIAAVPIVRRVFRRRRVA